MISDSISMGEINAGIVSRREYQFEMWDRDYTFTVFQVPLENLMVTARPKSTR